MKAKMAKRLRNLLEMPYVDVAERLREGCDLVLVPVGSTEKHGPHIPLGTDSFITYHVTQKAAEMADVLHTPLMPFGYSPHHMGLPGEGTGSVTLAAETYRRVLHDIARSLIYHGFRKIIFVSHHGSNTKPIDEILRALRYTTGAFLAFYKTPTEREIELLKGILEGPPEETPGWHSGELETSAMMALVPDSVFMDRAREGRAHAPAWMGPAFSKKDGTGTVIFQGSENIWVPMEHHEYADWATIGNPFRATAEKGHKILEKMAEHLAAFVEEAKKFPVELKTMDFPERAWY
ncbi:creatininase family protein [Thermus scotoductus]|uniref:creatininase family protein n=1 Tax=Thermus scotoductus TaxID=37636 RepID=UPI001561DAB3|nr:creatininase family protein [Thermus scotoductus]